MNYPNKKKIINENYIYYAEVKKDLDNAYQTLNNN